VEAPDHPLVSKEIQGVMVAYDLAMVINDAEIVVDFSNPEGATNHAKIASQNHRPIIIGVTALSQKQMEILQSLATDIPMVYAPNMSVGVNLMFKLIAHAAEVLRDYDFEVIEMHHRNKKDSPSGTAAKIADILSKYKEDPEFIYGRKGITGVRPHKLIAVHSLRGGDVVGEHRVIFAGPGERLELVHRAETRMTFAAGVIRAIRFVVNAEPGFYNMMDVLGLGGEW
jgi:4-hydroxy-tetrahydrodipicolinate reductase